MLSRRPYDEPSQPSKHLPSSDEIAASMDPMDRDSLTGRLRAVALHMAASIPGGRLLVRGQFSRILESTGDELLMDELYRAIELLAWVIEAGETVDADEAGEYAELSAAD